MSGGMGDAQRSQRISKCVERLTFNEFTYLLYGDKSALKRIRKLLTRYEYMVWNYYQGQKVKDEIETMIIGVKPDDDKVDIEYFTKIFNRMSPKRRLDALGVLKICYNAEGDIWTDKPEIKFDNHSYPFGGLKWEHIVRSKNIVDDEIKDKITVGLKERFEEYTIGDDVVEEVIETVYPEILDKIKVKDDG